MRFSQHRGFTLIEVLVALVVVSLSLTAAMKTTGDITNSSFYLKQKVFAHWVAQNRLAELELSGRWPGKGVTKDTTEMANLEWEWTQTTSETPHKDIFKIEIGVKLTDSDPDSDPITLLTSYYLNPELLIR